MRAQPKPLKGPTVTCPECHGTGTRPGAAVEAWAGKHIGSPMPERCPRCVGRGRVLDSLPAGDKRTCPHFLPVSDCALCRPRPA